MSISYQDQIRITSEIWVSAYRAMLEKKGIPIYINKVGDKTAGAILIKVSTMDEKAAVYDRTMDETGKRRWAEIANGTEDTINLLIKKQCTFDPDLWVLEIEDPKGRNHLSQFNF